MSIQQSADLYAEKLGDDQYIVAIKPGKNGTFTHRKFYARSPVCDIHEMGWAISMQSRFTGHMRKQYSVADHCVLVSELMRRPEIRERGGSVYEGLMHDAHEGYVSDLAAPWKVTVKDFRPFEAFIESAMRVQFQLPEKISDGVKYADWLALFIEAETLIAPGVTVDWFEPEPGTRETAIKLAHESAKYYPASWGQVPAYHRFIEQYLQLKPVGL
jgi:uncharacterized protein